MLISFAPTPQGQKRGDIMASFAVHHPLKIFEENFVAGIA
jgi:hypothetical protein